MAAPGRTKRVVLASVLQALAPISPRAPVRPGPPCHTNYSTPASLIRHEDGLQRVGWWGAIGAPPIVSTPSGSGWGMGVDNPHVSCPKQNVPHGASDIYRIVSCLTRTAAGLLVCSALEALSRARGARTASGVRWALAWTSEYKADRCLGRRGRRLLQIRRRRTPQVF